MDAGDDGPADVTSYFDDKAPKDGDVEYQVGSFIGSAASSADDPSVSYSDPATATFPDAPTGLSVTADDVNDVVNLTWTDNSNGADAFEIQWSSNGSDFFTIDTVPAGTTTFTDEEPQFGTANDYQIVAYRDPVVASSNVLESKPSNVDSDQPILPPIAVDDTNGGGNFDDTLAQYTTPVGHALTVQGGNGVLANDFDPQGRHLSIASYTQPAGGSVTLNQDGGFTYTPNPGFSGTDSFTYVLANSAGLQADPAEVDIQVATRPVVTAADFFNAGTQATLTIATATLAANDSNPDQSTLSYHIDAAPEHGSLTPTPDGNFTYAPTPGYSGLDHFSYHVNDGVQDSNSSNVVLSIGAHTLYTPPAPSQGEPTPALWWGSSLLHLYGEYEAAKRDLQTVGQDLADFGQAAEAAGQLGPDSGSAGAAATDNAIARMDVLTAAFDRYVSAATAAIDQAGVYEKTVYYTSDGDKSVLDAINALPLEVAGLHANAGQLNKFIGAMSNLGAGAGWMVANNTFTVEAAQSTHDALNRSIQVAGAASIAITGIEILTQQGCQLFVQHAMSQIIATGGAIAGGFAATQGLNYLSQKLGVDPAYLRIGADAFQLFCLVKAAQAEQLKNSSVDGDVNASVIRQIKALPDDARLTPRQIIELSKNIDAVLSKSLPVKAAAGNVQQVVDLFANNSRFRFIDQIPGAVDKINQALHQFGAGLKDD